MPSVTPWCPFKTHSKPFSLTYLWIYSILSFFTHKTMMLLKKVTTLLLLGCYLSGSKPLMEKSCWIPLLVSFVTSFFLWLYILWLCFHHFLLIMLLRAFYTDSSCLLLILAMNLSFVMTMIIWKVVLLFLSRKLCIKIFFL